MSSVHKLTDEERAQAAREIDNFFAFSRDVLEDPSILDQIPTGADIEAIPKHEAVAGRAYDIETAHMVATVTPPRRLDLVRRGVSSTIHEIGNALANRKPHRSSSQEPEP